MKILVRGCLDGSERRKSGRRSCTSSTLSTVTNIDTAVAVRTEDVSSESLTLSKGTWSARYGQRHRLERITNFPRDITPPVKVRIYERGDHYVLQWWDPAAKQNLSDRVDGDLVTAIARARELDERLVEQRTSGMQGKRLRHEELVARYLAAQEARANAGDVAPQTVARYRTALAHYLAFVEQPHVARQYPFAARVDREFQLELTGFLNQRWIAGNGHQATSRRPMQGQGFVEGTVRAMFAWALDPLEGNLLPARLANPFRRRGKSRQSAGANFGAPDITVDMAVQFLGACDGYQLALFAPLICYGLRAAEPCFLFREFLQDGWLTVPVIPELAYTTKGQREKRFPLVEPVARALEQLERRPGGPLYHQRGVGEKSRRSPLANAALAELIIDFQARLRQLRQPSAAQIAKLRTEVMAAAGAINYDTIEGEFRSLAGQLHWPRNATLKDFRHLFATLLENAGVPESYRRYFMGHAPGSAAIVTYTHLDEVREHFERAANGKLRPLIDAIERRLYELNPPSDSAKDPSATD